MELYTYVGKDEYGSPYSRLPRGPKFLWAHLRVFMAITSVETLLVFVGQRGYEYNDKIELKKYETKFGNY